MSCQNELPVEKSLQLRLQTAVETESIPTMRNLCLRMIRAIKHHMEQRLFDSFKMASNMAGKIVTKTGIFVCQIAIIIIIIIIIYYYYYYYLIIV